MRTVAASLAAAALLGAAGVAIDAGGAAAATARPVVSGLSAHAGVYWGGQTLTVHGQNFTNVTAVYFSGVKGYSLQVQSPTTLQIVTPWHQALQQTQLHVLTAGGRSAANKATGYRFTAPGLDTPIMGGLTARQEQRISARLRASHRSPSVAPRRTHWTAAMGRTAVQRAASWLGLPYSWAGGNGSAPTRGVCSRNGGDLDCHVIGFDCSGLSLYAWSPYRRLDHYAATQYSQAGKYHPLLAQLVPGDLVFFSAYIAGGIGHVGIYEGDGWVIEASDSGTVIRRSRLTDMIANDGVYRGASRPMSTGRQGAGPVVTSITPSVSSRGGMVVVTGKRLGSTTAVNLGGTLHYDFVSRSASQLVLRVPSHRAGKTTISVATAWGTVSRSLRYVDAPALTSLNPGSGPGNAGTSVVLTGQRMDSVTQVTVAGVPVPVEHLDASRLSIEMPAHAAGPVGVRVLSPSGASRVLIYTYTDSGTAASPPVTSSPAG